MLDGLVLFHKVGFHHVRSLYGALKAALLAPCVTLMGSSTTALFDNLAYMVIYNIENVALFVCRYMWCHTPLSVQCVEILTKPHPVTVVYYN